MRSLRRPRLADRHGTSRVVAVTGAAGLLGTACLRALTDRGERVVAVDRRRGRGPGSWRTADLRNADDASRALDGATHLIHLAGHPNPLDVSAADALLENVSITANTLRAFASGPATTAVFASTAAIYGFVWPDRDLVPLYVPIDEDHAIAPADPYTQSKLLSELLLARLAHDTGVTTVALRLCRVVSDDPQQVADVVGVFADDPRGVMALRNLWASLHVDDAADAFVRALDMGDGRSHVINIASVQSPLNDSLADLVAWAYPTAEQRDGLIEHGCFSVSKASQQLGWSPMRAFHV